MVHNCYLGTDQFQNWELSVLVLADEEFFNEIKNQTVLINMAEE